MSGREVVSLILVDPVMHYKLVSLLDKHANGVDIRGIIMHTRGFSWLDNWRKVEKRRVCGRIAR